MDKIKHYKILDKIGCGGMGEVYRAMDENLEREVALKVMHPALSNDPQSAERLVNEARAAARLMHPNVVTIYEVGESDGAKYIVMEYVNGRSLSEIIRQEGILDYERTTNIVLQLLRALAMAHKMGILHRDIKTENILVSDNDEVKVLDFGIAKLSHKPGLTVAGEVLGTVEYMPPEQMLGEEIDQRCDLYATGVVLYQCLTKSLPFNGHNAVEILFKKLNEEPLAPSYFNKKVPPSLDQVVLRALKHNKEERWKDAEDMVEALEAVLFGQRRKFSMAWGSEDGLDFAEETDPAYQELKLRKVFVGREDEFKKLISTFHRVAINEGQTIVISGEAGVGKSTLADQFRNYVEHQNAWVLYGTCLYQEGMDAYLPYIDALRTFFSKDNPRVSEKQRNELKELVYEKVPILAEFTERFSTTFFPRDTLINQNEQDQYSNLFEGIYALISMLSEVRPVVLVIDDLQWADGSSLRLFHYLSRQVINNKILLLGISRTDPYDLQENGKPKLIVNIMARMRREGLINQIELNRLSRDDCDNLIDRALGNTAFSEDFYEGLYSETKGNPFFILETLKLFQENGDIKQENDIWIDNKIDFKAAVPNRVEDIFMRRLSAVSEDDREMLQIGAVIGYKFDPSLLAQILDVKKIDLFRRLQKISNDFNLVASTDQYFQFEHPILGDLLYNEIPSVLAKEYHLIIAGEIERIHGKELGAMVGDVAEHYRKAGEYKKAIPLLYQAAIRAFEISAYREATLFFEDFLSSMKKIDEPFPESIDQHGFYFKMGICYEEIGQWDKSLENYQILAQKSQESENVQGVVDAYLRIGRVYDKLGEWEKAVDYYRQCMTLAEQNNINNVFSRVYNKMGIFFFHQGDFDKALMYFQKTIRSVDSERGEFDKAHAYTNIGIIANILRSGHGVALENFEKALTIYKKLNNKQDQARVYHNIGMFYANHDDWLESIKSFENCLKLADDVQSKHLRALTYLNMGKAYARQKKLVKARKLNEKALKIFKRMSDILSIGEAYLVYGIIHGTKGDFDRAVEYLSKAIDIFKDKDYKDGLAEAYETYGLLCADNGFLDEARSHYGKSIDVYKELRLDSRVKRLSRELDKIDNQVQATVHIETETFNTEVMTG